jgi:hypothetical protein
VGPVIGPVTAPALLVGITFSTPAGKPTSSSTEVSSSVVSGVSVAGLTIIVQPAAIAGAILRVAMASGKFHGVMNSDGPTGRLCTISRALPSGAIA